MFTVDEATAAAIRKAYVESGELSAMIELRRHFPGIADNECPAVRPDDRQLAAVAAPAPSVPPYAKEDRLTAAPSFVSRDLNCWRVSTDTALSSSGHC